MARRQGPMADITFEYVQHDRGWAVWLIAILGGVLAVFGFTALAVSLIHA
jgi:hypothetical protein